MSIVGAQRRGPGPDEIVKRFRGVVLWGAAVERAADERSREEEF